MISIACEPVASGLVRERTEVLVRGAVDDINDPFSLVRLDGDELSGEPSRLVEEAMGE